MDEKIKCKMPIMTFEKTKEWVKQQLKKDNVDLSILKRDGLAEIENVVNKIRKYRDKTVVWLNCADILEDEEMFDSVEDMEEWVWSNFVSCSMSCFIERYIISSPSLLERAYGSVYALGVTRQFNEDERKWQRFFCNLETVSEKVAYMSKKYSRKNGLRDLLSDYLGISFEEYVCPIEHKMRLLYNLCRLEYKNEAGEDVKVDLRPFLYKCNMENMASTSAPWRQPYNSELYDELKWHLESELGPEVTSQIEIKVYKITKLWENTILMVIAELILIPYAKKLCANDFQLAIEGLNKLCIESVPKQEEGNKSVLELFYTKLCVNETLGIEQNNIECLEEMKSARSERSITTEDAYKMQGNIWEIEKIEMEIEQHKKKWLELWSGKEISHYRFDKSKEYVVRIINMFKNNTKMELVSGLSELLVFSAFEVVFALDRNKKLENRYYRYKKNRTVYSNLQKEHRIEGKVEIMLIKLVMERVAFNVGSELMDSMETALSKLHCTIMGKSSDIDELVRSTEEISNYISVTLGELIDVHLLTYDEEYLDREIERVKLLANEMGYELVDTIRKGHLSSWGFVIRGQLEEIENVICQDELKCVVSRNYEYKGHINFRLKKK